jgi:hypothetical protein
MGYDRSPDYGGPPPSRGDVVLAAVAIVMLFALVWWALS